MVLDGSSGLANHPRGVWHWMVTMLCAQVGEVRLASVTVLETLYGSEETAPHLELFTQRFKERLLSMRLDREDAVCVKAIQLCAHLLALDLLEPEESQEVGDGVHMFIHCLND